MLGDRVDPGAPAGRADRAEPALPPVGRGHGHRGLDKALHLFRASALLELGMDSTDGTGAMLAWPLVRSAAALLTEVADGEDPGPSRPTPM